MEVRRVVLSRREVHHPFWSRDVPALQDVKTGEPIEIGKIEGLRMSFPFGSPTQLTFSDVYFCALTQLIASSRRASNSLSLPPNR
jgi:hypothetical protein